MIQLTSAKFTHLEFILYFSSFTQLQKLLFGSRDSFKRCDDETNGAGVVYIATRDHLRKAFACALFVYLTA